jgi:hypothetical protein
MEASATDSAGNCINRLLTETNEDLEEVLGSYD